jgi:predicted RNA binding protein YcfA (HicA-like mRNA interferase family)
MPKLRVLSGQEVCKIMFQHGFVEVRRKGSHIIMQKKEKLTTITSPYLTIKNCGLARLQGS